MAFKLLDERSKGILKFGDSVSLFFCPPSEALSDDANNLKDGGFLCAEGFVESNVLIQKVDNNLPPGSFRECLFEVWPRLTYSMQEEYLRHKRKKQEHFKKEDDYFKDQTKSLTGMSLPGLLLDPSEDADERSTELQRQRNIEIQNNLNENKSHFGAAIKYGEVIQLRHVKSQKFLTIFPRLVASKDSSCLRVKLDEHGNELSWLVIKPQFMYRSFGDVVEIGDQLSLHFKSHEKKAKLNASHSSEVNASNNTKAAWKVLRYSDAPNNSSLVDSQEKEENNIPKDVVSVGDMLKLSFPQIEDGYLVAQEVQGVVGVRFHVNRNDLDETDPELMLALSDSMWIIQQEYSHHGGYAKWDMTYLLRHHNTGYYLALDQSNEQKMTMVQNRHEAMRIFLQSTSSKHHANYVCSDKTIFIGSKHADGNVRGWVCQENEKSLIVSFHNSETFKHGASFILEQVPEALVLEAEISRVLCKMLAKVASKMQNDVEKEVSSWDSAHNDMRHLLSSCCDACLHLLYFMINRPDLYDTMRKKYVDFVQRAHNWDAEKQSANKPVKVRQLMLREHGVFTHCFVALLAVGNGLERVKDQTYVGMLRAIGSVLYRVIKVCFEDHRQNENYVAQLHVTGSRTKAKTTIDIMIEDQLKFDIGAAGALSRLFDNNRSLLETQINDQRLHKFYRMLYNHRPNRQLHQVFLGFFAAVCGCETGALQKNQVMVAQKLFLDNPPESIFLQTIIIEAQADRLSFSHCLKDYFVKKNSNGYHVPSGIVKKQVTSGEEEEEEEIKVSLKTYLSDHDQNSGEHQDTHCSDLCDDIYEDKDAGGGAYELYITAGDMMEGSEERDKIATLQELFTWYELKDKKEIVYPCNLAPESNGSIERLEQFDIPADGEETTICKKDAGGGSETKIKSTHKFSKVHRMWVEWTQGRETEKEKKIAAVPLRVLQEYAQKFPHDNVPPGVQDAIRAYYKYYLKQLSLIHEVAYTRNYSGIEIIQRMLPRKVVLSGMNKVLRPMLRSRFCNVMQAVYVDTSNESQLEVPFNTRPWDQSKKTDIFPRFDDGGNFSMLQAFIEKYLKTSHRKLMDADKPAWQDKDDEMLELDYSVLKLCELLLKFGSFSSNEEISHIAWYLLEALSLENAEDTIIDRTPVNSPHDNVDEYISERRTCCGMATSSTDAAKTGCTTEFIDSSWYTALLLMVTVVSFALWVIETIVSGDDGYSIDRLSFGDNCLSPTHYPCPTGMTVYWLNIVFTGIFVMDVILRLSIYSCKRYFNNFYCVVDFGTTVLDVVGILLAALDLQVPTLNVLLAFRLLRLGRLYKDYRRMTSLTLDANKKLWPRLSVRKFFLDREKDVSNGTTTMLEDPNLYAKYKDSNDMRYKPLAEGDLWFKVKALKVRLLHRMQRLEQEFHMSQLLIDMCAIVDHPEAEGKTVDLIIERAKERGLSLYNPDTVLHAGNKAERLQGLRTEQLRRMRATLLQLVLDPDKAILGSALKLLLFNARAMKDLILLCGQTKLMVGDLLNDNYAKMRRIVLKEVSPRVGQFELWALVEAGKDNLPFEQNINSLQTCFQDLLRLSKMDGTELQLGLVESDFVDLLREIIAIPKQYRDIGTNFKSEGKSAFIKDNPADRDAVNTFIHNALSKMLSCLNEFLLALLGFDSVTERDENVQERLFPLMTEFLPWVGTVPKSELVIIAIIKKNQQLSTRIQDSFIEEAVKQFNTGKRKRNRVPIMTLITGISWLRENKMRCTNQLCKSADSKDFFARQIQRTYTHPKASDLEHNQALLRMVSTMCTGKINITEAKMLELLDYRMLLAAVQSPTSSWNLKLSFLDTFYHVVANAELKIEDVGRSGEIMTLLRMFARHLTTLCGWRARTEESKDESNFHSTNLVTALTNNENMLDGDPLCLHPPEFLENDRVVPDGAIIELPMLVRFVVLHVAKIGSCLCIRYNDDLSNLNGRGVFREISFCSFYLSKIVVPDPHQHVSSTLIKFCIAMEELHEATVKIAGQITSATIQDLNVNDSAVEAHFAEWLNQGGQQVFERKTTWRHSKFNAEAKPGASPSSPPNVETKRVLDDNQYDLGKRQQVQQRFEHIISQVRKNPGLNEKFKMELFDSLNALITITPENRNPDNDNALGQKYVNGSDSETKLATAVFCIVSHLRNLVKPHPLLGREVIEPPPLVDQQDMLNTLKFLQTMLNALDEEVYKAASAHHVRSESGGDNVTTISACSDNWKWQLFDDKDVTKRIYRESWGNVLHGLLEANVMELCFELMPSGLIRKLKITSNAMKLANSIVTWAMKSDHLQTVQTRCIQFLDQQATKDDGCSSFFFAIQSIINDAITYIKEHKKLAIVDGKPQALADVKCLLQFLCNLCSDSFRPLQQMWLKQANIAAVNINVLELASRFLGTISDTALHLSKKDLQEQLPDVLTHVQNVVKFLAESVQGPCSANQEFLANSALIKHVNRVMKLISPFDCEELTGAECLESLMLCTRLYTDVLRMLLGLLEGRADNQVESEIIEELWFDGIVAYVRSFQERKGRLFSNVFSRESNQFEREDLSNMMCRCASLCGVLWLKLADVRPTIMQKKLKQIEASFELDPTAQLRKLKRPPELSFSNWVDKHVVTIEIYWKTNSGELSNGRLVNEHFPIPKLGSRIPNSQFDKMRRTADLTSTEAKLEHFLKFVKILNGKVRHEEYLRRMCECTRLFCNTRMVRYVSNLFLLLTVINFILVLISFEYDAYVMQEYSDVLSRYFFQSASNDHIEVFHCALTDATWWLGPVCDIMQGISVVMVVVAAALCVLKFIVEGWPIYVYEKERNSLHTLLSTPLLYSIFKVVWVSSTPKYWVVMLILLEIFFYIPSASKVLQSVTDPIAIWGAAIGLIVIVIFLFSIIVFQFYHKDFFENHHVCQTLITCFFECFNYGMRNGGGLGDSLWPYDFRSHPQTWTMRAIVDLIFFLLVNVILLNVVFGVIIDKFGEFRDTNIAQDFDRENKCYICGKERAEISAFTDFTEHITSHHNVVDYWRYILYLQELEKRPGKEKMTGLRVQELQKQPGRQQMTGLQSHVLSLVKKDSFDWFPVGRALVAESDS